MTVTASYDDDDDDQPSFDDELYERRMRVLSLRLGGMTYRDIATALKIDPSTARRDESAAKRMMTGDDIEGVIAGQRKVIADIRTANYRAMLNGDKDAATSILKGLDHEAKLLGLYAPTRIQTGPSHIEFSERAAELIAAVSPDTLKELLRGTAIDPNAQPDEQPIDAEVVSAVDDDAVSSVSDEATEDSDPTDEGDVGPACGPDTTVDVKPIDDGDGWSNI